MFAHREDDGSKWASYTKLFDKFVSFGRRLLIQMTVIDRDPTIEAAKTHNSQFDTCY